MKRLQNVIAAPVSVFLSYTVMERHLEHNFEVLFFVTALAHFSQVSFEKNIKIHPRGSKKKLKAIPSMVWCRLDSASAPSGDQALQTKLLQNFLKSLVGYS